VSKIKVKRVEIRKFYHKNWDSRLHYKIPTITKLTSRNRLSLKFKVSVLLIRFIHNNKFLSYQQAGLRFKIMNWRVGQLI